jgi:hypothetical protein
MTKTCGALHATLAALFTLGCSAGGGSLEVGAESGGKPSAPNGSGGTLGFGGSGNGPSAFSAHVESPRGVVVEFVTLSCSNACADVEAVAVGGYEPYAFVWEDGTTSPVRRVCPTSTTRYEITVTDAGTSGELPKPPRTVKAPLTANLIQCADGGVPVPDAGAVGPCESLASGFVASGAGANPQGHWQYGWSNALGAPLVPFTTFYPFTPISMGGAYAGAGYPNAAQWFDKANGFVSPDTYFSIPPVPQLQFNPTAAPSHPSEGNLAGDDWALAPGRVALAPGTAGQFAIARFSPPAPGTYSVSGFFEGLCGDNNSPVTTADVHVQHNQVDVGAGFLNTNGGGDTFSFSSEMSLLAGDTVDFVVGAAGGLIICPDVAALDAKVCGPL